MRRRQFLRAACASQRITGIYNTMVYVSTTTEYTKLAQTTQRYDEQILDLSAYSYHLPEERIAQSPIEPRDSSKLLVVDPTTGQYTDLIFHQITSLLKPGDTMVMNNTRVTARRLFGKRPSGGKVEVVLIQQLNPSDWLCIVKPGKRLMPGAEVELEDGINAVVTEHQPRGLRVLRFADPEQLTSSKHGVIPLPPYIHLPLPNEERYQTVYSQKPGSAAAPTAGLHFTPQLLQSIKQLGVNIAYVTLDVGLGTFHPPDPEMMRESRLHREHITVSQETADVINNTTGRIICVGTTSIRAVESASVAPRHIEPFQGETEIFIAPGYEFKIAEVMLTNFHVPASTPLFMTCAFGGRECILNAYQHALADTYRFLSFGDAMFITCRGH